jgi:uncharacterized protein YbcI
MKLKLIITLSILTVMTFKSFSQIEIKEHEFFELSGKTVKEYNGYIYLKYENKIDSTLVNNKSFFFKGKVNYPTESLLTTKNGFLSGQSLYLENRKMTVKITIKKNTTIINSITGNNTFQIMSDLQKYFQKHQSENDFTEKIYKKLDTIITKNLRNQFSGILLSDIIMDPIFTYNQAYSLFSKLNVNTQKEKYVKSIKASLEKLKNIRIGTTISDFELPNNKGKIVNTNKFKKKFLLIEF